MATNDFSKEGSCLCKKCKYTAHGNIMVSALCHCKACARAVGMSPVHLILLTPSEGASDVVDLKEGNVKVVEGMGKLRHVVCTDCGVCIYQYPDEAVFKAFFPTNFHIEEGVSCLLPEEMLPSSHLNYENRHYDWCDALPKFKCFPGGEEMDNQGNIVPKKE